MAPPGGVEGNYEACQPTRMSYRGRWWPLGDVMDANVYSRGAGGLQHDHNWASGGGSIAPAVVCASRPTSITTPCLTAIPWDHGPVAV